MYLSTDKWTEKQIFCLCGESSQLSYLSQKKYPKIALFRSETITKLYTFSGLWVNDVHRMYVCYVHCTMYVTEPMFCNEWIRNQFTIFVLVTESKKGSSSKKKHTHTRTISESWITKNYMEISFSCAFIQQQTKQKLLQNIVCMNKIFPYYNRLRARYAEVFFCARLLVRMLCVCMVSLLLFFGLSCFDFLFMSSAPYTYQFDFLDCWRHSDVSNIMLTIAPYALRTAWRFFLLLCFAFGASTRVHSSVHA